MSLRHRRLVSLTGAEAAKFLQGLITNDVDPKSYRPFYSAFLDARGRMLWDIFVWPQESETKEWGCLIEVDGGEAEGLMKHLKRHKLRSKIVIKLVEDEGESGITVCAGWGKEKEIEAFLESQRNSEPSGGHSIVAAMPDPRAGEAPESLPFAHRFLVQGTETEIPTTSSLPLLDPKQYTLRRYLFGVPEGPAEIPRENALPMENNIDLAGGINFKKGCYVGQELTIRTKHTGVVRKRVLPVQLYHTFEREPEGFNAEERALAQRLGVPLPRFDPDWTAGTEIEVPLDIKQVEENDDDEGVSFKKGRTRGKLIARVGNVGLAMCRLENMTAMKVSAEGGSYTPETRFGVQTGREGEERVLLVKAFLPHWLVQRERELWSRSKARAGQSA